MTELAGAGPARGHEPGSVRYRPMVDPTTSRATGWIVDAPAADWADVVSALGAAAKIPDGAVLVVTVPASALRSPDLASALKSLGPGAVVRVDGSPPEIAGAAAALAGLGVGICLDATHPEVLATIARERPAFTTVGPALVTDLQLHPEQVALVAAVVALTERLGVHLVAEGVTDEVELDVLRSLGVPLVSGDLFGPATPEPVASRIQAPLLDVDRVRVLRRRMAAAPSTTRLAELACDHLGRPGRLPAVYLQRDGLLRLVAQRGYWQSIDGVPLDRGVMGEAMRTGEPTLVEVTAADGFIGAVTGIAAEIAIPVRIKGRVVGVVSVESSEPLAEVDLDDIHLTAGLVEEGLRRLGTGESDAPLHRVAQAAGQLGDAVSPDQVEFALPELACATSGLSSSMVALPDPAGLLRVRASRGPLGRDLHALAPHMLLDLLGELESASSCITTGDHAGRVHPTMVELRDLGGAAVAVFPVRSTQLGTGLLIVADHAAVRLDGEVVEALELLAAEAGRALDRSILMADLREQVRRDSLTGLGNVQAFDDALAAIGGRRQGRWGVAMADVDGFKAVNDTYGHLTGDRLLRDLSTALSDVLRHEDRMFRLGGDEFAAVLHDVDAQGAADVCRRLCAAADEVLTPYGASLSIGLALPAASESAEDYRERADRALYEVKRGSPGSFLIAGPPEAA